MMSKHVMSALVEDQPRRQRTGSLFESWNISVPWQHALSLVITEGMQQVFSEIIERHLHRDSESQDGPNRLCSPDIPTWPLSSAALVLGARGCRRFMGATAGWLGWLETQWKSLPLPP